MGDIFIALILGAIYGLLIAAIAYLFFIIAWMILIMAKVFIWPNKDMKAFMLSQNGNLIEIDYNEYERVKSLYSDYQRINNEKANKHEETAKE